MRGHETSIVSSAPRWRAWKSFALGAALLAALTAAVPDSLGVDSMATGENGRIAFESYDGSGRPEIWTMKQDGSDLRRIGRGFDPAWSPDGSRIVFVSGDGNHKITVSADGGDTRVVEIVGLPTNVAVANPAVSPDGTTIAFRGVDGLYVAPSGGGLARLLAPGGAVFPSWSPDGRRIAFVDAGVYPYRRATHLWVIGADGSGLTKLSSVESPKGSQVAWSPDGSTIAYGDSRGGISTVRLDGSAPRVLVPYDGRPASDPAWSPDGKRIAFAGGEICVVNANGTGRRRLTYTAWPNQLTGDPAWQPLPAGSTPHGAPLAPSGPPASWDRNQSWGMACVLPRLHPGKILTGRVDRVRASVGAVVTYHFRLANRGNVPIGDADTAASFSATLDGGAQVLSVATRRGKCEVGASGWIYPAISFECRFGSLFPGQHEDVTVRAKTRSPGELKLEGFITEWTAGAKRRIKSVLIRRTAVAGCTIRGTQRANVLAGSPRADVICGLDGADRIRPGPGRDRVYAGPNADVVSVRDRQRDVVSCGSGLDSVTADNADHVAPDCERVKRR